MTLLNQIKADQLAARKNRETLKATLLTTLIGEATAIGKNDGNRETTDAEVVTVVNKFIKNINDLLTALNGAESGAAQQANAELVILDVYRPKQLTAEQLTAIIADLKAEVGASTIKEMGKVMGALRAKYEGQYDGKVASQLIKVALS